MLQEKIDIQELKRQILGTSEETRIYIGGDSKVFQSLDDGYKYVVYVTVVVIHYDGHCGGGVVREVLIERYYNSIKARLLREVGLIAELGAKVLEIAGNREVNVHLDIASDKQYFSHTIVKEATGYILGTLGISPELKPNGWASSTIADLSAVKISRKARRAKVNEF